MEKRKVKMISYIKNAEENEFEKSTYEGEEIFLKLPSQKNFKFVSNEGIRIVRINFSDNLKIKESHNNVNLEINFQENNFGLMKYIQEFNKRKYQTSFKTKLIEFKNNTNEIFIHYLILDDLLKTMVETKIFLQIGEI